ncbi:MAG: TolC family protein [Proteobacteria bacterium]|nr:TolC family protein [Pseudomonadota bacterium]
MKKFWLIPVILIFLASLGYSEEVQEDQQKRIPKMTLADCVMLAVKNNLDIRYGFLTRISDRFNLKVAEHKFTPFGVGAIQLSSKRTSINPQDIPRTTGSNQDAQFNTLVTIPTGGIFNFAWDNPASKADVQQTYQYSPTWALSFVQPLLRGGGVEVATASVKIARVSEEISIINLKTTAINTIVLAIVQYRAYAQALSQLNIDQKALETSQKTYETNKKLIDAGRMARTELVQSDADISQRKLQLVQDRNNIESARLALIQTLNIDQDTFFEPVEEGDVKVTPPSFQEAMKIARKNSPDYLQALQNLETGRLNYVVAKNNRLWDFSVTAGLGRSNITGTQYKSVYDASASAGKGDWNVGTTLSIPFNDMTYEQNYLTNKVAYDQAKVNLRKAEIALSIAVQNSVRTVELQFQQFELARQARVFSQQKLDIENKKLKAGQTSNFQLVSFQNDLINTQNNELFNFINYLNSLTLLDQTLGTTLKTWRIEIKKDDNEVKVADK